jgi:prophage maintenance system killer protein
LNLPSTEVVAAIKRSVLHEDEVFDEPSELDRISRILAGLANEDDPVRASALAASRIARSQAFAEGNKWTALLVARWILDRNGLDGKAIIPKSDLELANSLLRAARGEVVHSDLQDYRQRYMGVEVGARVCVEGEL